MVQEDRIKNKVIVVCGPTASGKSDLALSIAQELETEIVSADSIAVYKKLDIGTAKPDVAERERVKHNLIDIVDPTEEFSVAEYEDLGLKVLDRLFSEGKIPVICGGTGYFIDALLYKKSYGNCPKNPKIRAELDKITEEKGAQYLYGLLKEIDPETALKLSVNDTMRVSRALEIYYSTGKKKSDIVDENEPRFDFKAMSVDFEREVLYERINLRVDKMFVKGLVEEVKGLLDSGVSPNAQSMQGIGYKEIVSGLIEGLTIEEMKEIVKRNTRRYAKRQITYFKRTEGLIYLPPERAFLRAKEVLRDGRFID